MNRTRPVGLIALSCVALVFAVLAGAAIATFASNGAPPITGSWQQPTEVTATAEPPSSPSAAPSAAPTDEPSHSPEPEPPTATVAQSEPPTPTVPEPTPSLEPVAVETPAPSAAPEAPASPYIEYVVQPGDILKGIAERFDVSVAAIVELNPESDPDSLTVGEVLLIPR